MSLTACAALVEAGDPDRFAATMASPANTRASLWPLYAANLEIARAPWTSNEPMVGEMRLQWWIDTIGGLAKGDERAGQPVTEALTPILRARPVIGDLLVGIAEARRWDAWREPFEDRAAFDRYINETAGNLMWAAALSLGADNGAEQGVRDRAWAAGLAAYFQAIPELEARGRAPLVDGRPEAIAMLAGEGLDRLARARSIGTGRHASAALIPAWQAWPLLKKAHRDPTRIANGTLSLSPFERQLRLILASAGVIR